jgi:hypothetical protein
MTISATAWPIQLSAAHFGQQQRAFDGSALAGAEIGVEVARFGWIGNAVERQHHLQDDGARVGDCLRTEQMFVARRLVGQGRQRRPEVRQQFLDDSRLGACQQIRVFFHRCHADIIGGARIFAIT